MSDQETLAHRLASDTYDRQDVLNALRGEKLPKHLGYPLIKLGMIRGILRSPSFATGDAALLHGLPDHPEFTRALNARAIMSDRIPDMDPTNRPQEVPYCIWYPNIASSDTYRELVKNYPQTRYQVARACAVAGYTDLYLDLNDVLPEVAVAEEARAAGSHDIFNHIMQQTVRYRVFNDYSRTLNWESPQAGAHLNGDTCIVSIIESKKQAFRTPADPDDDYILAFLDDDGFKEMMFNITEDQGIAESVSDGDKAPSLTPAELMLDYLTLPLPVDLPAGNKDLLILAAAYYGDIDRYTRLHRSVQLEDEIFAVVRGIYHNPLFALWWERQVNPPVGAAFHMKHWDHIEQVITARHIVNNDISRAIAHRDDKDSLPYLIWYPEQARPATYRALANKVPAMREACVRAEIYADNIVLFDELFALPGVKPTPFLLYEAKKSGANSQYFISAINSRAEGLGISLLPADYGPEVWHEHWKLVSMRDTFIAQTDFHLRRDPSVNMINGEFVEQGAVYNGIKADASDLELYLMAPEAWRPRDELSVEVDYENWP